MLAVFLVVAVLLAAFGGFLAAADSAFAGLSRTDLLELAERARAKRSLRAIADDPGAHLNAANFTRVVAEMTAAVLVTLAFAIVFGSDWWWTLLTAALVMTGVSFVLAGSSPRSVGRARARGVARLAALPVHVIRVLLGPIAGALVALGNRVTPGRARAAALASEEQLLSMVDEAAAQDLIEEDDRELIHSVFDFTDRFVRAVMVPRTDMVTVDADATMDEAMKSFLQRGVSRMPVVDDDADDVVGVLYLKDLVLFAYRDDNAWRAESIRAISRPATFVPESMRAETLLQQMKRDAVHVCMVIDEHGGISGLVTLEDLIEELVGEIADEYDRVAEEVTEVAPGSFQVSARLSLDEVGDLFRIDLEDDDVDSVGGLLGKALGMIPQPGATAVVQGLRLTGGVSRGRGRGLATVFVERVGFAEEEESDA